MGAVVSHCTIFGQKRVSTADGMPDEHAIEWIPMARRMRQLMIGRKNGGVQRLNAELKFLRKIGDLRRVGVGQHEFPQTAFEAYFQKADRADDHLACGILEHGVRTVTEFFGFVQGPDQRVGIKHPCHGSLRGEKFIFAHAPIFKNRLATLGQWTESPQCPRSLGKRYKDRDILTLAPPLHHDALTLRHRIEQQGQVSFEFRNGDRFHVSNLIKVDKLSTL